MGQIVKDAHPLSFQIIGNCYAKDYQHVFQYGQIIDNLHPQYFQPPITYPMHVSIPADNTSYKIQDFKVFFDNQYVPHARWIDFTNLGQGYGMI